MKLYSPHSRSTTASSLEPLEVTGISTSRLHCIRTSNHITGRRRPQSASISTFSTRRNDRFHSQHPRPMTARSRSKTQLLNESTIRIYPQRNDLCPPRYSPDDIARALRLQRQYEKTLQKRSRIIHRRTMPKFRSLSKSQSCHNVKIRDSKQSLYETPYHSMNVENFVYRPLSKPLRRWDTKKTSTRPEPISLNTTESYKRLGSMMDNLYRGSVKDFFGEQYDLQTGLDENYHLSKQHKRPIYL